MILKKDCWKTDDTCPHCGNQGMVLKIEGEIVGPEIFTEGETMEFWGTLSCPKCYDLLLAYSGHIKGNLSSGKGLVLGLYAVQEQVEDD